MMETVFTEQQLSLRISETSYLSGHLIKIGGESPSSLRLFVVSQILA